MTIIEESAASAVSATITNVFDLFTKRGSEERRSRELHAKTLVAALAPIVADLRMLEERQSTKRWKKRVGTLYSALDELRPVLPPQWHHLKGSIRDSVGSAIGGGIVFVDLISVPNDATLEPRSRWTMHAADYLDETCRAVRVWGTTRSNRHARRQTCLSFNTWVNQHNLQH